MLLRAPQILERLSISRSTLHRWVREGRFPPPVQLGPNVSCWRASTVEAWLDEKFTPAQ